MYIFFKITIKEICSKNHKRENFIAILFSLKNTVKFKKFMFRYIYLYKKKNNFSYFKKPRETMKPFSEIR